MLAERGARGPPVRVARYPAAAPAPSTPGAGAGALNRARRSSGFDGRRLLDPRTRFDVETPRVST